MGIAYQKVPLPATLFQERSAEMIYPVEKHGDHGAGTWRTKGQLLAYEHLVGAFESEHRQRGHFLEAEIRIRFDGGDPFAAQSLGDPHIWRSLAFRGYIEQRWEDIPSYSETSPTFDRALTLSYTSVATGDETDLEQIETAANTDLAAINALVGSLVRANLHAHTPAVA